MLETINVSNIKGEDIDITHMFNTVVGNVFHRSYTGSHQREESSTMKNFFDWDVKYKKLMGYFCFADFFPSFAWIDRLTGFTTLLKSTYSELDSIMEKIINEREKESFVDVLIGLRDTDKLDYEVKAIMEVCVTSN